MRIAEDLRHFERFIHAVQDNRDLLVSYQRELEGIPEEATEEEAKQHRVPYRVYIQRERALCEEETLHPIVSPRMVCSTSYCSPHGRNVYRGDQSFTFDELRMLYCQGNGK